MGGKGQTGGSSSRTTHAAGSSSRRCRTLGTHFSPPSSHCATMAEGRLANLSVSSWVRGLDLERNGQGYGDSPLWHPSSAHDTRESQHTPGGEGTPGSTSSSGARPTPPPGHRRFGSSGALAPTAAGGPPPRFSVVHTPQPGRASPVLSSAWRAGRHVRGRIPLCWHLGLCTCGLTRPSLCPRNRQRQCGGVPSTAIAEQPAAIRRAV